MTLFPGLPVYKLYYLHSHPEFPEQGVLLFKMPAELDKSVGFFLVDIIGGDKVSSPAYNLK